MRAFRSVSPELGKFSGLRFVYKHRTGPGEHMLKSNSASLGTPSLTGVGAEKEAGRRSSLAVGEAAVVLRRRKCILASSGGMLAGHHLVLGEALELCVDSGAVVVGELH